MPDTLARAGVPGCPPPLWLPHPARAARPDGAHPLNTGPRILPPLLLTRPDGVQDTLPGWLWPELARADDGGHPSLPSYAPMGIVPITRKQVNRHLRAWAHPLGAYDRPFGEQHWLMIADGEPIAAASSASTVSATLWEKTWRRPECVELARIASNPRPRRFRNTRAAQRSLRVMLRAWTDWCAPLWEQRYWRPYTAISYALPGKAGNLYRFDGWLRVGKVKPWGAACGYSKPSRADQFDDGLKTLWVYPWLQPETPGPLPPGHPQSHR